MVGALRGRRKVVPGRRDQVALLPAGGEQHERQKQAKTAVHEPVPNARRASATRLRTSSGAAVRLAEDKGVALDKLALEEMQGIDARIGEGVFAALSVESSVAARASYGGTAPDEVRKRVADARRALGTGS